VPVSSKDSAHHGMLLTFSNFFKKPQQDTASDQALKCIGSN
jgi:hypothetical protein